MTADESRRLVALTLAAAVFLAGVTGGYGTAALLRDEAATGATFSAAGNFETASGPPPSVGNAPDRGAGNVPASTAGNAASGPPPSENGTESSIPAGPAGPPDRQQRSPQRHASFETTRTGRDHGFGRADS